MTAEVLLFAYGTLQDPAVQTAVFGHALAPHPGTGAPDRLRGFRLSHIPVEDPPIDGPPVDAPEITAETGLTHYPILIPTTDDAPPVPGRLYPLTPADLTAADAYEGEAYRRVRVRTEAGAEAWVYVATC
ncbi:MAG: gamma-glutamylcyclotransferase [Alphaproteobacteria bacterium]|uniref:gamma-glutamylcyclotransferase family protein n=1 Tax=Brevundimonas sp. TaxID=1871086 RepID=UPI0035666A39|nr:gamma-glutamylcyclotransferase [Alphaproteobacteria bacterium]MBU2164687.1 gamma-glutamylcyclotransferase [Alphaproteobacteria bacterium]MBU2230424.1 gamma-glutamylcyclotransferase [Alphaproteobacteria bacterium]